MSKASDLAYRYIRGEILSGGLAPGEQLREEHLADACGVSRTPVREALRRLEAQGFIRRNDAKRTFVSDWSFDEIDESFSLRGLLESHAAARAATRISEESINRLHDLNRAIDKAGRKSPPDVASFLDNNRRFHTILLESAASDRLSTLLESIVEQPIVARTARQYDREEIIRSVQEHDDIILAFRRRDPEWARAVMTAHIRRALYAYRDAFRRLSISRPQAAE